MKQREYAYGYQGGYLIGFIMISVVALRAIRGCTILCVNEGRRFVE